MSLCYFNSIILILCNFSFQKRTISTAVAFLLLSTRPFYRAMHFSANARSWDRNVVRLSVCLSVTLMDCDHIVWKSWKLITRTTSPSPSLFAAKRRSTYSQGNMGKLWGDKRKSGMLENKSGNISETRKDRGKVTMDDLQKLTNALSNGTIPDTLRPPLPQNLGFAITTENFNLKFRANEC